MREKQTLATRLATPHRITGERLSLLQHEAGALSKGGRVKDISITAVTHAALSPSEVEELRRMFDDEYLDQFGMWDPKEPYGYAGHEVHVVARAYDTVVGHVGWARRLIEVGDSEVVIAGVGGVLVSSQARGSHLGERLMRCAAGSMSDAGGVEFGYLGCREDVVPFYVSCGWHRVSAPERSISRRGLPVLDRAGPPLLVLPVERELASWPEGTIDLRGRAW